MDSVSHKRLEEALAHSAHVLRGLAVVLEEKGLRASLRDATQSHDVVFRQDEGSDRSPILFLVRLSGYSG